MLGESFQLPSSSLKRCASVVQFADRPSFSQGVLGCSVVYRAFECFCHNQPSWLLPTRGPLGVRELLSLLLSSSSGSRSSMMQISSSGETSLAATLRFHRSSIRSHHHWTGCPLSSAYRALFASVPWPMCSLVLGLVPGHPGIGQISDEPSTSFWQ